MEWKFMQMLLAKLQGTRGNSELLESKDEWKNSFEEINNQIRAMKE